MMGIKPSTITGGSLYWKDYLFSLHRLEWDDVPSNY